MLRPAKLAVLAMMLFAGSPSLAADPGLKSTLGIDATSGADHYQDWRVGLTLGTGLLMAAMRRAQLAVPPAGQHQVCRR